MAYSRPVNYVDNDPATPVNAANLHLMQDGLAAYTDSVVTSGVGTVKTTLSTAQTIQPSADVVALAFKAAAGSAAATPVVQVKDDDDSVRAEINSSGQVRSRREGTGTPNFQAFHTADTQPMWQQNGAVTSYGPGGATSPDVTVQRGTYVSQLTGSSLLSLDFVNASNAAQPLTLTGTALRLSKATGLNTHDATPLEVRSIFDVNAQVPQASIRVQADMRNPSGGETTVYTRGIESYAVFGSPTTVGSGTGHAFTGTVIVQRGSSGSEHAVYFGMLRYENQYGSTSGGRAWLTDWAVHGLEDAQQSLISGVNMVVNNRYNGSPNRSPSYAFAAMTAPGAGGGWDGGTTYASDVGYWVLGQSSAGSSAYGGNTQTGFHVAFKVGHGTHPRTGTPLAGAGGWDLGFTTVGKGMQVDDYIDTGIHVNSRRGATAQAIRTETAAGASYFRGGLAIGSPKAGPPVDADYSVASDGLLAIDITNLRLYCRVGGAWRYATLT